MSQSLSLQSNDGQSFDVARDHAKLSGLLRVLCEEDPDVAQVPVPQFGGDVVGLVTEYLTHHAGVVPRAIERPLRSRVLADVCADRWDAEFTERVGADPQLALELIRAANYFDIQSLLDLGCAKLAALVKAEPHIRQQLMQVVRATVPAIAPVIDAFLAPAPAPPKAEVKREPPTVASVAAAIAKARSVDELVRVMEQQLQAIRDAPKPAAGAGANANANANADAGGGAGAAAAPKAPAGPWTCAVCTYANAGARSVCEMCQSAKE